ncbi:MAG TPA: UDP-glucose 4-epimerase GalE [Verrucomicrobiae bacterium]|nr:UDP-glucose 4-epimerase GalE [Verrucomicrobiae bacterium]
MKIFVTGGAGYVGSICVEELLNAGHEVVVFDNLSEGHRQAIDPRADFVEGDLLDRPFVAKAMGHSQPDAVMHFGAATLVPESMVQPGKHFLNNVAGGVNLLDACMQAGVRKFVFSSTCAIFGIPDSDRLSEDLPKKPINPYGESKWMFERVLDWYAKLHGLQYICLRYFNAAGASRKFGEHHNHETHLIPIVLQVALGQRPHVEIYGTDYPTPDGTCVRDYIHIIDLAQAHILALSYPETTVFNLGSGNGFSVKQVIETARKITGHPIAAKESPRRAGDPPKLVADSTKARTKLGWKPRFDTVESIIDTAWQWQKAHPRGYES